MPMRDGVSSLNLATTVAAVLFSQRLCNLGGLGSVDRGNEANLAAPLAVALIAGLLASLGLRSPPGPGPAQASGTKTVDIDNFKFRPPKLEVATGTKVVFSNSSGTAHTATGKGVFDSGRIKPGRSFAVRFQQKGTFRYHCEIHPFMQGKIVVG